MGVRASERASFKKSYRVRVRVLCSRASIKTRVHVAGLATSTIERVK